MRLRDFPFGVVDWSEVAATEHPGLRGKAISRTRQLGEVRVRMVEYGADYVADHWCSKGHVIHVVTGELRLELGDGRGYTLRPGMSCQVADDAEPHRAVTASGATVFIVD